MCYVWCEYLTQITKVSKIDRGKNLKEKQMGLKSISKLAGSLLALVLTMPAITHASDSTCYYWGIAPGHTSNENGNADTQVVLDVIELTKAQVDGNYLPKSISDFGSANLSRMNLARVEYAQNFEKGSCYDSRQKVENERLEFIAKFNREDHKYGSLKKLVQLHGNWFQLKEDDRSDNGSDISWSNAMAYCKGKGMDLPNAEELGHIYDNARRGQYKFTGHYMWSNVKDDSNERALFMSLGGGGRMESNKVTYSDGMRAICVRRP